MRESDDKHTVDSGKHLFETHAERRSPRRSLQRAIPMVMFIVHELLKA